MRRVDRYLSYVAAAHLIIFIGLLVKFRTEVQFTECFVSEQTVKINDNDRG